GPAGREQDGDVSPAARDVQLGRRPGEREGDVPAAGVRRDGRREQAVAVHVTAAGRKAQGPAEVAGGQVTAAGVHGDRAFRPGDRDIAAAAVQRDAALQAADLHVAAAGGQADNSPRRHGELRVKTAVAGRDPAVEVEVASVHRQVRADEAVVGG